MSQHAQRWADIASRINPQDAGNIDDLLFAYDSRAAKCAGHAIMPKGQSVGFHAGFRDPETAIIGYRVREMRADLPAVAMRLAMFAAERGADVVILSDLPYSGLERFGFRVERVCGETQEDRDACADQLKDFWAMDVVL